MTSSGASMTGDTGPFPSLSALRDAHSQLLKQYRDSSSKHKLIKQIEGFIQRGRATGTLLGDDEDRWDAQTCLDYWATILCDNGYESPDTTLVEFGPLAKLAKTLDQITTGEYTEADIKSLRQTLAKGIEQGIFQVGKYNINIGQAKDIHIGDRTYQPIDSETIRQVLIEILGDIKSRTLLTSAEFSERVEKLALASYKVALIGREAILGKMQQHFTQATQVIVLRGVAGLGKTRLLLALSDIVSSDEKFLWYVRNEAESIEKDIELLDKSKQHIIVVDDAHRCKFLYQLREVLASPLFAGKVTLVLATRSIFKDSVIYQLGLLAAQVITVEVNPLENRDIDQLLQNPPYNLTDQDVRHSIIRISEGNPLMAGVAAQLIQKGVSLANFSRDQVLSSYLDDIIKELSETKDTASDSYLLYLRFLQITAALGTINLDEEELRAEIQKVVGLSPIDEERIIAHLVEIGLIEKYWKTIRISSEVLAEHILIQHFFNPKTKQADYHKQIIEPFFALKPKEILNNLAEVEFKTESAEAGQLLSQKLYEFRRLINQKGNLFRFNLLQSLREIAYFRPNDILFIVASIVDASETPIETIEYQLWGTYHISHEMVLSNAVELLKRTIYQGGLRDAIAYLHKLAVYRLENREYGTVRSIASKALMEIAEFRLHKPYQIQLQLLDFISVWLEQDFVTNLPLSLALIQRMLSMNFHSAETNPIQPFSIVIHQGDWQIVETLKQIRERSLEILYNAYQQAQDLPNRLQIVQALGGATPYLREKEQIAAQTLEQLQSDCAKTARFFSQFVIPNAELPVLDKVAEWLSQAQNFHKYQAKELDYLQQQLQNRSGYQLYRLLVGGRRWDDRHRHNGLDWQTATQQKQQKINEYVEAISLSKLEQVIQELEAIANQAFSAGRNDAFGLNDLLRAFGEKQLNLALLFMEQVIAKNLLLKQHLGFILAGLRLSNLEVARTFVRLWIKQDDPVLWVAIAISYRFIDWSQPQLEEEWHILRQLVAKQSLVVDPALFWSIQDLAPYQSDLAVELLKTLAARGNDNILHQVAEVVSWQIGNNNDYAVKFDNLQDLLEIIQNFERLSYLDYNAEECLKRLADITPMQVIDFIESRIRVKPSRQSTKDYYEAFPKPFSRIFDDIKSKLEYPEILRHVRDWMLQDDFVMQFEAPALLRGVALNLEGELYNVLREWVNSGDVVKIGAVARILREFNFGQNFYNLSREIILRTQDEAVLSSIHAAIRSTPSVVVGSMSNFYNQRIEEVSPWLNDESFRVRDFANHLIRSLQISIEREEAEEQLRERNW